MTPETTISELSRHLGIDRKAVRRYVEAGMPRSTAEAVAWRAVNVTPRVKTTAGGKGNPYQHARTRSALLDVEERELDLLEKKQQLVNRDKVRAEMARRLSSLRDALLQIPARLQSVLAAETDDAKCHDLLQDELHAVLAQSLDAL